MSKELGSRHRNHRERRASLLHCVAVRTGVGCSFAMVGLCMYSAFVSAIEDNDRSYDRNGYALLCFSQSQQLGAAISKQGSEFRHGHDNTPLSSVGVLQTYQPVASLG